MPVTLKFKAAEVMVLDPDMVRVPPTLGLLVMKVATDPPVFMDSRLLKVTPVIFCAKAFTKRTVPEPAAKVPVLVKFPPNSSLPVSLFMVPGFVRAPVVVTTPDPTLSVPLFCRVDAKDLFPDTDPSAPVEDTAAANVMSPLVEVTTLPERTVATPVTASVFVADERVAVPFMSNVPTTVELASKVAVSAVLVMRRLLKFTPMMLCAAVPLKMTVPASRVKVPPLEKFPVK